MEEKEIRVLKSDVEVPPVVLEKADAAFARIKEERVNEMKNKKEKSQEQSRIIKYMKPAIVAAACALIFAGVGSRAGVGQPPAPGARGDETQEAPAPGSQGAQQAPAAQTQQTGENAAEETKQAPGNRFTMTAYAKELQPGRAVPLTTTGDSGRSYVLSGGEDGSVSYCISTDFLCQGENIERIGYRINRGAFQVVQVEGQDDGVIVDGQPYDGKLNVGGIGGGYDEASDEPQPGITFDYYQSILLDYDRQSADTTWINICDECQNSTEIFDLIWNDANDPDQENEGISRLLSGTVITCTAYYTDGTSQSVDIAVESCVMTYEEAGEVCGEGEIPPDTRKVFITFEVK